MYESLLDPISVPTPTEAALTPIAVEAAKTAPEVVSGASNGHVPAFSSSDSQELRELLAVAIDVPARQKAARDLVTKAIARLSQSRGETWIQKARLRPFLQRMDPTFHESSLGFKTFNEMIASMNDIVETRKGESDHQLRLR